MIEIKTIGKPKRDSAVSGRGSSASGVPHYGYAEEAAHATKADSAIYADTSAYAEKAGKADRATYADSAGDIAEGSPAEERFLSSIKDDEAEGHITFKKGLTSLFQALLKGGAVFGEQGGSVDGEGNAKFLLLVVRSMLTSPVFVNGFTGEGWRMWLDDKGLSNLEVDKLTVRQLMTVFELIIERIRAVGGQIVVSAANGRIKAVSERGEYYRIRFEESNQFQEGDLIRCHVFTGKEMRGYWAEVHSVMGNTDIFVAKSEFTPYKTTPREGDEVVLMGSTTNELRQNLIVISATEDGQPRIDVLNGVKGKSFAGCLRARLGNLDGISDSSFPADNQPRGDGLYADNAYLKGTFVLSTGEDVKTLFAVTDGKIISTVENARGEISEMTGYLTNPGFDGQRYWIFEDNTRLFVEQRKYLWMGRAPLGISNGAWIETDGMRRVVRINNGLIRQRNEYMRIPTVKTDPTTGRLIPLPLTVRFYFRALTAGTLKLMFEGERDTATGYRPFSPLDVSMDYGLSREGYSLVEITKEWSGKGDFLLSYSGECMIYGLYAGEDTRQMADRHRTLFEQTDRLVRFTAENIDTDGSIKESSGIMLESAFAKMFSTAVDENGLAHHAEVETRVTRDEMNKALSEVRITGDRINLVGATSINGKFVIHEDGTMEAVDGKFSGELTAKEGAIAGFKIVGNSLENDSFTPDAHIRFKDEKGDCEISLGTGEQTGITSNYLALLRNRGASNWWYNERNTAMMYDVSGADFNMAFEGNGHGMLNGCVQGWKAQKIILKNAPLDINTEIINMADGDRVFVSSPSGGNLRLPNLLEIRRFIGNAEGVFALELTITGLPGGRNFMLYGRCSMFDATWYAQIKNNNGDNIERIEVGSGDSLTLILTNVNDELEAYIKHKQI